MYILAYSILTPIIAVFLPMVLNNENGWLITILMSMLGIIFSVTNLIEKRNKVAIIVLVVNIGVFIYSIIATVNYWTN
ncbi:MAG TPA: hypothetical protein VK068_01810 [Jeotgalicoccus sp.]|nr:hypothetical protein [Jeotgalicoccus sp.]